eukprot:7346222-Lingulodinium_polyedra.AAC.1
MPIRQTLRRADRNAIGRARLLDELGAQTHSMGMALSQQLADPHRRIGPCSTQTAIEIGRRRQHRT